MATVYFPQIQLAAGNNNTGSLVAIESIKPTGDDYYFVAPRVYGTYLPGARRIRSDGTLYFAGFPVFEWRFALWTRLQAQYLSVTYCNGGYAGAVTVRSRTEDPDTYANFNAVMVLPSLSELGQKSGIFIDTVARFIKVTAI